MAGEGRRDAEAELNLPPGFRFHPTDEELVVDYLVSKASGQRLPVPIIAEVDLYKFDPWDLPELALFGKREWYFFTPRERKYQNGSRPNRAAGRGYWKATGADKPVSARGSGRTVGIKKALVFYHGKAPRGVKTDWIMHEYRLADVDRSAGGRKGGSLRLDDCVLCRLYNKKNNWAKTQQSKEHLRVASMETADVPLRSYSPWTSDSDIEQDSFFDRADTSRPGNNHSQPSGSQGILHQGRIENDSSFQIKEEAKEEDSDWFSDLNLDDFLQSSGWAAMASASDLGHSLQINQSNDMAPLLWN